MDDREQFRAMVQQRRQARDRMMTFRWVLIALSAVLAIVLIASGAVLIGAVIAGSAKVMVPRHRRETERPVRPRRAWRMRGREYRRARAGASERSVI